MIIDRETALEAVKESFGEGIKQMGAVFVMGLESGESVDVLLERFNRGYAQQVEAHEKMAEAVEAYHARQA